MLHQIDLRALAERSGPERAFLSLYLDGPEALGALDGRIDTVRQLLTGQETELEYLEENIRLIRSYLDEHSFTSEGLCLFACWATDYLQVFELDHAVPTLLWVDSSPYIRPLAELQDEYETFVVVTADNTRSQIFLVTSATPEEETRVRGDIKNRVKVGGWSQKRYQRRRDKELERYASDVVDALRDLDEREAFDRIFLLGSDEAMREIENALPEPLLDKLAGTETVDLNDDEQVWDEAFTLFFEEERAQEASLWQRIQNEYMRGGQAAVGPGAVLKAARVGQVEALLVERDAKIGGIRCRKCENLSAGLPDRCPVCGSADVFKEDLVNELAELMATSSARTEFADPIEGLTKVGRVAALLRY